jgi:hypothetical protein
VTSLFDGTLGAYALLSCMAQSKPELSTLPRLTHGFPERAHAKQRGESDLTVSLNATRTPF